MHLRRHRPALDALDEDEAFEQVVRSAATAVSAAVTSYDHDEVRLSGMRLSGTIGLTDVRQVCRQRPREQWRDVVLEHLLGLDQALRAGPDLTDAERVLPALRSRLYAEGRYLLTDVAARAFAPGVIEALVVHRAGAIATLHPGVVAGWGIEGGALYERARRQVRENGLVEQRMVDLDGVSLTVLESGSHFTATHACWLAEYVDPPPAGLLVALPNRHCVLACALTGREATLTAAQAMLVNAHAFHDQGPGSLSPHLYWWRGGVLTLLPAQVDAERISFRPTAEFVAVLDALPAA